jgi:hypothetical protein
MSLHVHKLKRVIEKGEDGIVRDVDYDFSDDLQHVYHVPGMRPIDYIRIGMRLQRARARRNLNRDNIVYMGDALPMLAFIHSPVKSVD